MNQFDLFVASPVLPLGAHLAPGAPPVPAKPARNVRTGVRLKREGQAIALDNSGDEWRNTVLSCLKYWVVNRGPFRFEQFRAWWDENGGRQPHSLNSWGAITSAACAAKIIKWTERYETAHATAAHGRAVKVWEAV